MLSLLMVIEEHLNEVLEEYHDFDHYMIYAIPCYDLTRYALKKELDSKNNSESMYQLGNLALSIQVRQSQKSESVA